MLFLCCRRQGSTTSMQALDTTKGTTSTPAGSAGATSCTPPVRQQTSVSSRKKLQKLSRQERALRQGSSAPLLPTMLPTAQRLPRPNMCHGEKTSIQTGTARMSESVTKPSSPSSSPGVCYVPIGCGMVYEATMPSSQTVALPLSTTAQTGSRIIGGNDQSEDSQPLVHRPELPALPNGSREAQKSPRASSSCLLMIFGGLVLWLVISLQIRILTSQEVMTEVAQPPTPPPPTPPHEPPPSPPPASPYGCVLLPTIGGDELPLLPALLSMALLYGCVLLTRTSVSQSSQTVSAPFESSQVLADEGALGA